MEDKGERKCEPLSLRLMGLATGAMLLVLFVRLLNDPDLPPALHAWTVALVLVGMGRVSCLGSRWLLDQSPVALPPGRSAVERLAKVAVWLPFGIGLPMAKFATLSLLLHLSRPPGRPELFPAWTGPLHEGPGIVLGMALMFVPTALVCLVIVPVARQILRRADLMTDADLWAGRAGMALVGYSLAVLYFLLQPDSQRLGQAIMSAFTPAALPNHFMAIAAAGGVWKVWFALKARGLGGLCPGCSTEAGPGVESASQPAPAPAGTPESPAPPAGPAGGPPAQAASEGKPAEPSSPKPEGSSERGKKDRKASEPS
jgi:hypothetical protein